jgi:hypothetical protein
LEEEVEGVEAHHLPQVAAEEVAGGGRNRQATAAVIRVAREESEERERRTLTVWVSLTDPAARLGGFGPASWDGLNQWAKAQIEFEFKT